MGWIVILMVGGGIATGVNRALGPLATGPGATFAVLAIAAFMAGTGVYQVNEYLGTNEPIQEFALDVTGFEKPGDAVYQCTDEETESADLVRFFPSMLLGLVLIFACGGLVILGTLALPWTVLCLALGAIAFAFTRKRITFGLGAIGVLCASTGIVLGALGYRLLHAVTVWGCT